MKAEQNALASNRSRSTSRFSRDISGPSGDAGRDAGRSNGAIASLLLFKLAKTHQPDRYFMSADDVKFASR